MGAGLSPSTCYPRRPVGKSVVVIGAGPAGLTAAYELQKLGHLSVILEADRVVGGISRTVNYKGYRFDIGGHRFFTKVKEVNDIWHEILQDEFLTRGRLSRIYYQGKFFDYPLKPMNALMGLGPVEAMRIGMSYLKAQAFPSREERNLEQWVTNRFGRRLFEIFFKTYTEKVWGIPCSEIGADWAAQRIKNLDLAAAIKNAFLGSGSRKGEIITTLIDQFEYPRHGPGMMWEKCRDLLAARGSETLFDAGVRRVERRDSRVLAVHYGQNGNETRLDGEDFISSMPLKLLIEALDPPPPPEVLAAAAKLRYRDFLTVALMVEQPDLFPDNWIYIHSSAVKMGRIQNFKNWSPHMVPDPTKSSLGLEYFVQENDELWSSSNDALVALGTQECDRLGLVNASDVVDGTVVRMPKAYPVYDGEYQGALATIQQYLSTFENLQTVGRNGLHRYNNQDHSMVTALHAARNVDGGKFDVWNVNVEQEYHEEVRDGEEARGREMVSTSGDRSVPQRTGGPSVEELLEDAFALYDPIALGVAVGAVCALILFAATAGVLLQPPWPGEPVGGTLAILGNFAVGFEVSWWGACLGGLQAGLGGFLLGYVIARAINLLIEWTERGLWKELELEKVMDPTEVDP